jgi:D-3-phosphoglycerate dehydrogenase / 2-oxoglutarate reductase
MKKVLIPTKLEKVARELLQANGGYDVVQDDSENLEKLAKEHPDAYAVIVRSNPVTPEIIDSLPKLKLIVRAGAGYNTIDTKYARQKGVDVMNTPGANANAVAEEVIALMLADARHVVAGDVTTRAGKWEKKRFMGREITGKKVGLLGLGAIGRLVAKRLSGFDVTLLGYDPIVTEEQARAFNIKFTDIETIFSQSDYISLHMPENAETKKMVGAKLLSLMKDGATLINCARSGIVDEDAIREAKKSKKIRFLNDVYAKDVEGDKSVADIADIMLPHLGANTVEANTNAARQAAQQIIEFDKTGKSNAIVN